MRVVLGMGALRWRTMILSLTVLAAAVPAMAGGFADNPPPGARPLAVLLIYTEPRLAPAIVAIDEAFRSTLESRVRRPVFFHTEYLDLHAAEAAQADMRGVLVRKYAGRQLDLVFAVSSPALKFASQHRGTLFPRIPVVFAAVDARAMAGVRLDADVTGTWLKQRWDLTLDVALRFHPDTRRVVVVTGNGAADKVWLAEAEAQLAPYRSRVEITYRTGLPFGAVVAEVAALPPGSLLLLGPFTRDAENREFVAAQAVKTIGAAASIPTYSFSEAVLGTGIVGGNAVSFRMHGVRSAELAAQVLSGARPAPTSEGTNYYVFDGRQLTRWSIDERNVPAGSEIRFREPSAWQLYRWYILGAAAVILLQASLIGRLLVSRRQRRRAQADLAERLRFEMLVSEVVTACTTATVDQLDDRLRDGLRRVATFLGVDRGALWQRAPASSLLSLTHAWERSGAPAPRVTFDLQFFPYLHTQMEAGDIVCFTTPDELPAEAAAERAETGRVGVRSLAALPLRAGGRLHGVLVFLTLHAERQWPVHIVQQLRTLAEPFSTALIRVQSAVAVESSAAMAGAVLAALPGETAIVDSAGTIVQTNTAWATAVRSGVNGQLVLKVGANYLDACRNAIDMPPGIARTLHASIESILRGEREEFAVEYPTSRHGEDRWFEVRVRRLAHLGGGAAVMNFDVTARRQAEATAQRHLAQIAHLDRVAGMGQLASSLAHELNQPLAGILANAQAATLLLSSSHADIDELRACLADIINDDRRAGEVIRGMRQLLKKTAFVTRALTLNDLAADTIRLVANEALLHAVTIEFLPARALSVCYGDIVQIQQVILNLLTNAITAAAHEGAATRKVTVWTSELTAPYVEVGVHDSGPGIADTNFGRIFEPFFTTKLDGLGMGLTISHTIVEAHGGRLLVENDPAGGATFRVHLRTDQSGTT